MYMTQITIRVSDSEKASALLQLLNSLDFVEQVDATETRSEQDFSGIFSDLSAEQWQVFTETLNRDAMMFPERDVTW